MQHARLAAVSPVAPVVSSCVWSTFRLPTPLSCGASAPRRLATSASATFKHYTCGTRAIATTPMLTNATISPPFQLLCMLYRYTVYLRRQDNADDYRSSMVVNTCGPVGSGSSEDGSTDGHPGKEDGADAIWYLHVPQAASPCSHIMVEEE
jgi:hypothetical protein